MTLTLRAEEPRDFDAIFGVVERAFGQPGEARLVSDLRGTVEPWISLVALERDTVVGHVLFTPVHTEGPGDSTPAIALAPVAVEPARQGDGIGSRLVRAGLAACRDIGELLVFVLGHKDYYPRFGFGPAGLDGFDFRGEEVDPSFMLIELEPGAIAGRSGRVRYADAFYRL